MVKNWENEVGSCLLSVALSFSVLAWYVIVWRQNLILDFNLFLLCLMLWVLCNKISEECEVHGDISGY